MTTAVPTRPRNEAASAATTDLLVVFGISGDLAKVMTFRSLYRLERRGLLRCPILGVAVDDWGDDELRAHARAAIEACGETNDEETFARRAGRLSYFRGDFADPTTFDRLGTVIDGAHSPVFYLEIPPSLFAIDSVQITMAESFGVEDRGHFYDPVGALRDVVVNHLMQVVAAVAMEPPAGKDPRTLKDAIAAVLRATRSAEPKHYVRGQHDGYRPIAGVAADSETETYAALRLDIDSWRWAGVPFYIRTGKCLAVVDARRGDVPQPESVALDVEFADSAGAGATPYEVLLDAAMRGDSSRFRRMDAVEEQWRLMQPLLDAPPPVQPYARGTWGPAAADHLPARHGGWHEPWVAS